MVYDSSYNNHFKAKVTENPSACQKDMENVFIYKTSAPNLLGARDQSHGGFSEN